MPYPLSKSLFIMTITFALSACGGSSSGGNSDPVSQAPEADIKTLDSLVHTFSIQNDQCPNGGVEIEMGIDANSNQRLDPGEVDHGRTQTVCHGANGLDGSNGTDGNDGSDGSNSLISITSTTAGECSAGGKKILIGVDLNANKILDANEALQTELICNEVINTETQIGSLVSTSAEQVGNNCAAGGVRIDSGVDVNGDQILAASEIQSTQYVCSGINGTDGTDGVDGADGIDGADGADGIDGSDGISNLDYLLIETVDEPFGSNCLHGGDKHRIGLDEDQDGVLQESEVLSASYSCNSNGAPYIKFLSSQGDKAISGFDYALNIQSYDDNNSIYGSDDVELTITSKPDWLVLTESNSNYLTLQGNVAGIIGDTFTIKASSTDGDLTTEKEYTVTLVDGIQISISAEAVNEGNLTEQGQPIETPAEFVVSLSKAASSIVQIQYQVNAELSSYGLDWKIDNRHGVMVFEVGETEKRLSLTVLSDNQYELAESISLNAYAVDYTGEGFILLQNQQSLVITNDDVAQIELHAGQDNFVTILDLQDGYFESIELNNYPEWMSYSQQSQSACDQFGCNGQQILAITGMPQLEIIGETASFDIEVKAAGRIIAKTLTYIITEGDVDNDGTVDSVDAFPENPRGQTDSDTDGLGDEWEIANFDSLILANGTSDFDVNGITDKSAFENHTPINDISFNFESGELPVGWVNTGNVDWVVSDAFSYDGQYALTIEHPLAPNESATIEYEVSTQMGALNLYARSVGQVNNASLWLYSSQNDRQSVSPRADYWSSNSQHFKAGKHKIAIKYRNHSSTHNAPVVYIDKISGLAGIIPADRDGDGVKNNLDLFPDRSDAATDTDEDGMGDEWEQSFFGTLDRATATSDFDDDGLLDINEFIQATNPSSRDSDDDGIPDGDDAFPNNAQYQADTDNDGLADKWELAHFTSLETSDGNQDSDGDLITDLAEFEAGTPPTPDRDGDGSADVVDAFPDNAAYKLDRDEDGIADEWENQYGSTSYFSADGDHDNDGRSNLKEFIEGTNPIQKNLNAVEDIISVVQGQSITFNPAENDIPSQGSLGGITTTSVSLPEGEQANLGSLQNNGDGTFSYTAANDRLGWLRLSYVANDGESAASGEIFIHIVDSTPAQVVKIDSTDYYSYHSMALFDDGSLYAWGANSYGQLGLGTTINNYVPTLVGGLPEIIDFSLGYHFSLALASDGSVWTWGGGVSAATQLAATGIKGIAANDCCSSSEYYLLQQDGTVLRGSSLVAGLSNIKEIKAGYGYLLALGEDGIVWALGSNARGQLGYGQDTSSVSSPVQVSKITNIQSIETGNYQSFAIDADGQLFAWGNNGNAQLGDGTIINRNVPVLVSGLTNVAKVAAGHSHTLVRTESGDMYGMGSVSGIYSSTPRKLSEEKVTSIGAGHLSSFFITEDGLSYSFGSNTNGQLGDGTTQDHSEAAEISWLLDGVVSELGKEGFEWGRTPPYWRNSGNNWEVVSNTTATDVNSGSYAVKVKNRLTDSASASLGLQIATGAGDVSFSVKTSTEADYDKLVFYVDGVELANYSGVNGWVSSASFAVTAGVHSFEWIYHKDGGTSFGEDTVWIDDILLPIDSDGDGIIDREDATPYVPNPVVP